MQFPQAPEIGDEVTNDLTGAVYRWDGLMWHNVPVEAKGARVDGFEEDLAKLVADQQRQDFALLQEKRERQDMDSCLQGGIDELETKGEELQGAVQDLHNYDDGPIRDDLTQLQEGFDAAVIAAQEGAENLTLELQSYSKKTHNHDGTYSALEHAHDYLPLAGGSLTGTLRTKLVKCNRETGFAFEAKPGDTNTTAFIHTAGHASFSGRVEVDGVDLAKVTHTHPDLAAADHTHTGFAAEDHTHTGFAAESHTHAEYSPTNHTHSSYAVSNHNHDTRYADKNTEQRWRFKPAQLEWMYRGTVSNSNDPGNGNFVYHPGGSNGIQGYMRLSFKTYNGVDLSDGKFSDTVVTMNDGPAGTIWQWRSDVDKWKLILQFRVKHFRWNYHNHFEFGLSSQNGRTMEGLGSANYFVTVGGFF